MAKARAADRAAPGCAACWREICRLVPATWLPAPLFLSEGSPAAHADRILQKPPDIATRRGQSAGRWVNCAPPPAAGTRPAGGLASSGTSLGLAASLVVGTAGGILNLHLPPGTAKVSSGLCPVGWEASTVAPGVCSGSGLYGKFMEKGVIIFSRYNEMSHWMTAAVPGEPV